MAIYLNTNKGLVNFYELYREKYFVDKSEIIELINEKIATKSKYLKYNTLEIRDEVISMVAWQEIDITIDEEFRAGQGAPETKEEIYSAMIVLGFLSYYDGYLKIPNKELMQEFEKALGDESLKKNDTPQNAIKQIRDKEYVQKFKKEYKDREVLAVAICYDSNTKEHSCIIESI